MFFLPLYIVFEVNMVGIEVIVMTCLACVGVETHVLLDCVSRFLKSSVEAHISSCLGLIWVFHDLLGVPLLIYCNGF